MASITGTVNTAQQLYDALLDFITDSGLLGSEAWQIAWQATPSDPNPTDVVVQGPGLSATEQIYVGLRLNQDALNNRYSISMTGCSGIIPSATQYDQHVNAAPDPKRVFLINQPMAYWFSANGRRFTATIKVSTVYQSLYAGFILPYSLPTNYSYPLFIGGMAGTSGPAAALSWTDITDAHRFYPYAALSVNPVGSAFSSSAALLDPMGQWLDVTGFRVSNQFGQVGVLPYEGFSGLNINRDSNLVNLNAVTNYPYNSMAARIRSDFDTNFSLVPLTLVQQTPSDQVYGILDGVYQVAGDNQSAENTISIGTDQYLVVPNAFRSGALDFIAVGI
jgi:hypothetical protein